MKPERIQLRRTKGWRIPPNTLRVTRGKYNPFANPFRIGGWFKVGNGKPGGFSWVECVSAAHLTPDFVQVRDRAHAVELYREYRRLYPLTPEQIQQIKAADFIACWCPVDGQPCHGDVLIEIASK